MSGGHYQYGYMRLNELADDIEREFLNGGVYMEEDWAHGSIELVECDRLSDATEAERKFILIEIYSLIEDLRKCSIRAKELEWYMSGDTGATTYLERLRKTGLLK